MSYHVITFSKVTTTSISAQYINSFQCSFQNNPVFSDWVNPSMVHKSHFLQSVFSGGGYHHKLFTSFMQTNFVTTSLKVMRLQKLSPLVTTGLLDMNRRYCVLWIHCNSTLSLISALAELLLLTCYTRGLACEHGSCTLNHVFGCFIKCRFVWCIWITHSLSPLPFINLLSLQRTTTSSSSTCICINRQAYQLEEASTHNSAKKCASNVFCASWPWPLAFWPKINGFYRATLC